MRNSIKAFQQIGILLIGCILISCTGRAQVATTGPETLKSVSPFPVGVAVGENMLKTDAGYRKVISEEFNSLTPENAGKIEQLHPAENRFDFSGLDSIVDFAMKHKMRVHGTTLIWHDFSDLVWLKNFKGDSTAWENLFKTHIQTVVRHFKGKIASWDVVNEPFHSNGTLRVEERAGSDDPGSLWARHLGKDYIARAFQYAHEADPDALLFLNDFDLQYSKYQKKIDAVVSLANDFKKRGIPINGLGMQMHIGISASNDEIASGMKQLASTGLMVHISEVSILVSDWKKNPGLIFSEELNQKQSDKYRFIAQIYQETVPAAQRHGITIWGLDDSHTWITGMFGLRDWPLPFDSLFRKKPAYFGFLSGLKGSGREEPKIVAQWSFDEEQSRKIIDQAGGLEDSIQGNYRLVNGIAGKALKLDGFTTFIRRSAAKGPALSGAFSCEAWVAAATYPWNWCPVVSQERSKEAGFYFGVGPQGQAGLFASVDGVWQGCESKTKIRLKTWTHLAATFDERTGFKIYIDGMPAGQSPVSGRLVMAPESDLMIGMNRDKVAPSNPVRAYATLPAWFSFDGIFDEIRIYKGVLTPNSVLEHRASHLQPPPPEIAERVMPSGPSGPGRFGAYYMKLKYYDEWDALFRTGDYSDVVVRFDNSPVKVVFWRGTRYSPAWVMENGQWMADQSAEYFDTINGCFEHMIDPHCLYSHVRIIENTSARVVVHWRYIPVSVRKQLSQVDEKSGWSDCIDEYYTFYPDGTGVRKVVQYTSGEPLGPSEAIALCQPGTTPEDNVNLDAMTLVNLKGESHTYSWANGAPMFKKGENPENPVIQIVNLKSKIKPFMIFEPGNNMAVYGIEQRPDASHFPWWNHWPDAQLPCDGRYCQAPDRASHFSLAWGGPPFHDENGKVIKARESGSEGSLDQGEPRMKTVNTYWSSWMYGASTQSPAELAILARSWAQPPVLKVNTAGFISRGYDLTQRAYLLESSGIQADHLDLELMASEGSPIDNICFVIKGWNSDEVNVRLDDRILVKNIDFRPGIVRNPETDDLILWIGLNSTKPAGIRISKK